MLVELGLVEQRYQAVLEVLNNASTVTDVAVRFGVTRQTVHRWLRKYAAGGIAGLVDGSAKPLSCPHQMPPEVGLVDDPASRTQVPVDGRRCDRYAVMVLEMPSDRGRPCVEARHGQLVTKTHDQIHHVDRSCVRRGAGPTRSWLERNVAFSAVAGDEFVDP